MRNPKVSIIILTKNGGEIFERSLEMIFCQKVFFDFEVIAVDSGSKDGTLACINKYPIRLFKIKPKDFIFGKTRDFAFAQAEGDFIVTLSQDCIPVEKDWLVKLTSPLFDNIADVVQGHGIPYLDKKIFFWEKEGLFYFTREGREFSRSYGGVSLSCTNLAIKKVAWEDVKFGDVLMNEDKVIQKKLFQKNYKMIMRKDACVYHGHNYNFLSLIKRCENEGLGWMYAGVEYSFFQMLSDFFQSKTIYRILLKGVQNGEVRTLSEFFFLWLRPICLFKGNHYSKKVRF